MMYPVRTTLLLTIDENTARKFFRDEASVESRPSRWSALLRRLRQLRSFIVPHCNRGGKSPCEMPTRVQVYHSS